ncbi:hypothetical protein KC19_4G258500 [Ceratodon purpureus]|uniref:Secreted protein n=1 Tax=Ceratodon purpureus TaxID=3225 RepID=A0A8T0IET5_CERPU|nr:hypothetical protein KC19_4G258500 [Ceratodon purpureus]
MITLRLIQMVVRYSLSVASFCSGGEEECSLGGKLSERQVSMTRLLSAVLAMLYCTDNKKYRKTQDSWGSFVVRTGRYCSVHSHC